MNGNSKLPRPHSEASPGAERRDLGRLLRSAQPRCSQRNREIRLPVNGLHLEQIADNGIEDKAKLAQAIRSIKHDGVLGTTSFDDHGQTQIPVEIEIKVVKDGAWTTKTN